MNKKNNDSHFESIKCPECGKVQNAEVEHTIPFFTYVHRCINCDHFITESDWNICNYKINKQHGKSNI